MTQDIKAPQPTPVTLTVDDLLGFDITSMTLLTTCKTCAHKEYAITSGDQAKRVLITKLNQIIADRT